LIVARNPVETQPDGVQTTGHEWDGIREFDTPLPRWWLWVMYATIVWSIGYWIAMPAWPLVRDYTRGVLGYSQRLTLADEMAAAKVAQAKFVDTIAATPLEDIRTDPTLLEFAVAGGRSAFAVNCSQCHGRGAAGFPGYPNLNDDAWMWGGSLEAIHRTIRFGIRSGHPDARDSAMPAFLRDRLLTSAQINDVAEYVLQLSKRATDAPAAARGSTIFQTQCAACHKPTGSGNVEFGAPNLTDAIWLYGGEKQQIVESVAYSRRGVMPPWEGRLDPVTIKQLAVYVHSLGGGE
jgi:cytochrome c oxidase cbb3-type subunit 3